MAACLMHLRKTSFTSLLGDRRDRCRYLVLANRNFWTFSATFNKTETHKGRGYVWKANIAHVCFVWKWKKLKNLFKCPLVNETLWPETETFGFHSETRPRPSHTLPRPRRLKNTSRDRLETETSRPRLQLWCDPIWQVTPRSSEMKRCTRL